MNSLKIKQFLFLILSIFSQIAYLIALVYVKYLLFHSTKNIIYGIIGVGFLIVYTVVSTKIHNKIISILNDTQYGDKLISTILMSWKFLIIIFFIIKGLLFTPVTLLIGIILLIVTIYFDKIYVIFILFGLILFAQTLIKKSIIILPIYITWTSITLIYPFLSINYFCIFRGIKVIMANLYNKKNKV